MSFKELVRLDHLTTLRTEEFNPLMTAINVWLLENLKYQLDYEWSIASFTYTDRYGVSEYPYGVFINNDSDRLAFKLRFKL